MSENSMSDQRLDHCMSRRRALASLMALPVAIRSASGNAMAQARPMEWTQENAFLDLRQQLGPRLFPVQIPDLGTAAGRQLLANPVAVGDEPALTQSSGWVDGWRSIPSRYVVRARDATDVSRAVRFARAHGVPLAIKGGGHSYHGTSCAADSLLIWTRAMNDVQVHDAFIPSGSRTEPVPAVSLGAGCTWATAYDAVTRQTGRFVQGGGCTTVGVAGLIQGGGFGNFSKAYGLAAASLVEAEIVTADGLTRTVHANREPELFWALKGGGGGTFGIVTRVTLRTHELPDTFGAIRFTIQARDDGAFKRLLDRFFEHYRTVLLNPHWGEQVIVTPSRRLIGEMVFQGLDERSVRKAWAAFMGFVTADSRAFDVVEPLQVFSTPARLFWDAENMNGLMPGVMMRDPRPNAASSAFWWTGDGEQAGRLWHGMESLWLGQDLLLSGPRERLVDALMQASRIWPVSLHFNKGLAGGTDFARSTVVETAINPEVADAFCLAIIASNGASSYPGAGSSPDWSEARKDGAEIRRAMQALRVVSPAGGSYLYESDYHLSDWARRYWGSNVDRLENIKRRYDPEGFFHVHHSIGAI